MNNLPDSIDPMHEGKRHPDDLQNFSKDNALARLIRCLFAENLLNFDTLILAPDRHCAWFALWHERSFLYFTHLTIAPAQTVQNKGQIWLIQEGDQRHLIDHPADLMRHIAPLLNVICDDQAIDRLLGDIANSIENDTLARVHRKKWSAELKNKIEQANTKGLIDYLRQAMPMHHAAMLLDQWGALEGHPFYPTWKAKPGLSADDVKALSPEFGVKVPLQIAALRIDWAYVETMPHVDSYPIWFAQNFPDIWQEWCEGLKGRDEDPAKWVPLPIHGWHLDHFVRTEFAKYVDEGILILEGPQIATWPSMSFRTMLPDTSYLCPFIKLPVAIWLTSEQRTLQAKSIHMGPRLSHVIATILAAENGFDEILEIFTEELGVIFRHGETMDERQGRFLSVVYRNTDCLERTDGLISVTVAALLAAGPMNREPMNAGSMNREITNTSPINERVLLCEFVDAYQAEHQGSVEDFFRSYVRVVVPPVLAMYLLYGIAFEAHQQNTSILFDENGMPEKVLIRDFGDGRSFAPLLNERGYMIKPFFQKGILPTTFDDDIRFVRSFVIDACFICHLHEIALKLSHEYELKDHVLWQILREETAATFDHFRGRMLSDEFWIEERAAFLDEPWPTRSVLRMHLEGYADYRREHFLPNPLLGDHPTLGKCQDVT